jgi:hypothetical protein
VFSKKAEVEGKRKTAFGAPISKQSARLKFLKDQLLARFEAC